jgi:hypothetical protein
MGDSKKGLELAIEPRAYDALEREFQQVKNTYAHMNLIWIPLR